MRYTRRSVSSRYSSRIVAAPFPPPVATAVLFAGRRDGELRVGARG